MQACKLRVCELQVYEFRVSELWAKQSASFELRV